MTGKDWNAVRFDPRRKAGHVESYFLKLNDPKGRRALWLKATIFCDARSPDTARAEAWAISFHGGEGHVAVKQELGFGDASFSSSGLAIEVGSLELTHGRVQGSVASDDHNISFSLGFTTGEPPLVMFPAEAMYELPLPRSKLVTPHPQSLFNGYYEVDGARVEVDGWPGMQGHNWGSEHAHLYAWGHCNVWDQEKALVFEGVTARVKAGPFLAPPLTLVTIRHEGRTYAFNGLIPMLRAKGQIQDLHWHFWTAGAPGTVEGTLEAEQDDFVGLYYQNPDGAMTHCLNTKIGKMTLVFKPRGQREIRLSSQAAALEIGTRDPSHGVRMYV